MLSVCLVPSKLDEFICLLPCDYCAHVHRDGDAQMIYRAALQLAVQKLFNVQDN